VSKQAPQWVISRWANQGEAEGFWRVADGGDKVVNEMRIIKAALGENMSVCDDCGGIGRYNEFTILSRGPDDVNYVEVCSTCLSRRMGKHD